MFRHSELEKLRREREKRKRSTSQQDDYDIEAGLLESGERDATPLPNVEVSNNSEVKHSTAFGTSKKKRPKKATKGRQQEPKPDLRKRTWDVVETGLDSLEYD